MPAERLPMRKVREVLRLKHACGVSERVIARSLGVSRSTVAEYLRRAAVIGLAWPIPADLDDAALERRLFTPPGFHAGPTQPLPDWSRLHTELRRRGVTLLLLWEEYRAEHSHGYGYSRFCCSTVHGGGRSARPCARPMSPARSCSSTSPGTRVPVVDPLSGEVGAAHIFVAVLGASNYTFAQACWSEGLADWTAAHVCAFGFFGGVSALVVCDNLKAGVTAACRYESGINRSYQDLAAHYGTTILPTRVRKPRDKAKVEVAVLIVERWILARLRHRRFFSLAELNAAISELLAALNARPMRKIGATRRQLFESIDAPALAALPAEPYEYAEWKKARVAPDYHIELHGHFYSVPSGLIRQTVEARITEAGVEVFHNGKRVAAHVRSRVKNRHTTVCEHMPSAHRRYAEWTPQRISREAADVGPATAHLIETIMHAKPHPEQGFRAALGILRLAKSYGGVRLEAACLRGLDIGASTYGSIASILKNGLDKAFHADAEPTNEPIRHGNIRGRGYYH
ncbi:MAG: IS21 family transposase [Amaricoccus sp.]|uniref:IS21 family transposase n=1 Tax=Amaricoccus sp. TaxID=1872485 RepID=UPI00331523BE